MLANGPSFSPRIIKNSGGAFVFQRLSQDIDLHLAAKQSGLIKLKQNSQTSGLYLMGTYDS